MSGNLTAVGEISGILPKIMEMSENRQGISHCLVSGHLVLTVTEACLLQSHRPLWSSENPKKCPGIPQCLSVVIPKQSCWTMRWCIYEHWTQQHWIPWIFREGSSKCFTYLFLFLYYWLFQCYFAVFNKHLYVHTLYNKTCKYCVWCVCVIGCVSVCMCEKMNL